MKRIEAYGGGGALKNRNKIQRGRPTNAKDKEASEKAKRGNTVIGQQHCQPHWIHRLEVLQTAALCILWPSRMNLSDKDTKKR